MKIIWDAIGKFISPVVILTVGCVILGAVGVMYMSSYYVTTEAYARDKMSLSRQIQIGDARARISNLDVRKDNATQQLWTTKQAAKRDKSDEDLQIRIKELQDTLKEIQINKSRLDKQIEGLNCGKY